MKPSCHLARRQRNLSSRVATLSKLAGWVLERQIHDYSTLLARFQTAGTLLLTAIVTCGLSSTAYAARQTPVSGHMQTTICPDLRLANDLATGQYGAMKEAHERALSGDLLARDLMVRHELDHYISSHAWYSPNGSIEALQLGAALETAASLKDPNASLMYQWILERPYFLDLIDTSTHYAVMEARIRQLMGNNRYYWKQLELRRDVQANTGSRGVWIQPQIAVKQIMKGTEGPCGMLYKEQLATAYANGIGVPHDLPSAAAQYASAAADGVVSAQYAESALLLLKRPECHNAPAAIALLHRSAFEGYVSSWTLLGRLYQIGTCVDRNRDSAEQYYGEASRRGSLVATFLLGRMLSQETYSPVRWARGIILLQATANRVGPAAWAVSAVTNVYTALCANVPVQVKLSMLRDAKGAGIAPMSGKTNALTASPEACSMARSAMMPLMRTDSDRALARLVK